MGDRRALRRMPSSECELDPWQKQCQQDLRGVGDEAFNKRKPLIEVIASLPKPTAEEAVQQVAEAYALATRATCEAAERYARDLLQPRLDAVENGKSCILQWRFDAEARHGQAPQAGRPKGGPRQRQHGSALPPQLHKHGGTSPNMQPPYAVPEPRPTP